MKEPGRCDDQFQEKVKRHKFIWSKEIDLQIDTKLFFHTGERNQSNQNLRDKVEFTYLISHLWST